MKRSHFSRENNNKERQKEFLLIYFFFVSFTFFFTYTCHLIEIYFYSFEMKFVFDDK